MRIFRPAAALRLASPAFFAALPLLAAASSSASPAAQEATYAFGAERPLERDLRRIAVRAEEPAQTLAAAGLHLKLSPGPLPGWWFAKVPHKKRNAQGVDALLARLSDLNGVDFAAPVYRGLEGGPVIPTRDLLIGYDPSIAPEEALDSFGSFPELEVVEEEFGGMPGAFKLRFAGRSGLRAMEYARLLGAQEGVRFSEPDMLFTGSGSHTPNDPGFPDCWGLHNTGQGGGLPGADMNLPETWDITKGSSSIQVLVIDTGVQQDHPDLNLLPGVDLTIDGPGDGGPVNNYDNHGTAVAGAIAAVMDNAYGTVGVAPESPVASARAFITTTPGGSWAAQSSWTVGALAFGESIGAEISNNSNSYGFASGAIEAKYLDSRMAGMAHFASAGNTGSAALTYPATLSAVQAVAALDATDALASFSNHGNGLAFSAPGVGILTTDRTGGLGYGAGDTVALSGSSYASPYAAGIAALVLSAGPWVAPAELELILAEGARDLGPTGYDTTFGHGALDAYASVARCGFERYCTAAPNSAGSAARLDPAGTNSVSANNLELRVSGAVPFQYGLFFYGPERIETPFGDGYRCVHGAFYRLGSPVKLDPAGAAQFAVDLSTGAPAGGPGRIAAGDRWCFQFWYRDPAGLGGSGFNLSDALELKFCP